MIDSTEGGAHILSNAEPFHIRDWYQKVIPYRQGHNSVKRLHVYRAHDSMLAPGERSLVLPFCCNYQKGMLGVYLRPSA